MDNDKIMDDNQLHFTYKSGIIDGKEASVQDMMFHNAKLQNHTFFIACDNTESPTEGSKMFASFTDIDEFLEIEKRLADEDKNCYEMLTGEIVEIYDIDGNYSQQAFLNEDDSRRTYDDVLNDFIDARLDFQDTFYKDIPLVRNHFIIKKTDDPKNAGTPKEKFSLHIIIRNGMKFENTTDLKKFTNKFKRYYTPFYSKIKFDKAIYSKNRNIRMLGHSKASDTRRKSYRYPEFSSFNDICDKRLFFASHLIGTESYYPNVADDDEFVNITDFTDKRKDFKYELDSKDGDPEIGNKNFDRLMRLILESIENEELTICDSEIPNKLNYCDWKNLVFTVFNCLKDDERLCRNWFDKLFPYYRNSHELKMDDTWNNMSKYIGRYDKLTLKTLHYFARQNPKYKDLFREEFKAHTDFVVYNLYKKAKLSAEKNLLKPNPVTYIHEFPSLVQLSDKNPYTVEYIQKIINAICPNVCNGGKNAIYAYTQNYNESAKRAIPSYTINKLKTLKDLGGFLNIRVKVLNDNFESQYQEYEEQQKQLRRGMKIKKAKDELNRPQIFETRYVTQDTPAQKSIISIMTIENLLKTYKEAVFKPYLHVKDVKVYDDCLNLFSGFPHSDVLTDESITPELYLNSDIFANFKNKLCNGEKELSSFEYVDNYVAHMIQKPFERPDTMIVLSGSQGTGKDLFISFIQSMIGSNLVVQIDKMESLLQNFNTSIAQKLLTKVNEISDKGIHIDKHDQLKEKITCEFLTIEPKGFDKYQIDHVSRYIGFSNKDNILNVESSDRRFMMIKTVNDMANNVPYHTQIKKQMDDINMIRSAFKYYATKDISEYQPRIIPNTVYKADQKMASLPYTLKFLYHYFEEHIVPFDFYIDVESKYSSKRVETKEQTLTKQSEELYTDYVNWCVKMGNSTKVPRLTMVKDFEGLGLVQERVTGRDRTRKQGFVTTRTAIEKLFQDYLRDKTLKMPIMEKETTESTTTNPNVIDNHCNKPKLLGGSRK